MGDFPYKKLVELYSRLEKTTKKILMTNLIAHFLTEVPSDSLEEVIRLLSGQIFREWEEKELGVAEKLVLRAISIATGVPRERIEEYWKKFGDLGEAARLAVQNKKQVTLFRTPLTVKKVYQTLRKIGELEGEGSIDKKVTLVAELLINAEPEEAKYIVRTILDELRVGVGEGIIRDALSKAFRVDPKLLERAYYLTSDFAYVAKIAAEEGEAGLKKIKIELGRPIKVMLAQAVKDIEEGFRVVGSPCAIEYKYDGARMQIHKKGNKVYLFTRRLTDVTKQFPEVVEYVKKYVKTENCILEGETVAWDYENDRPRPFQVLSRRIQRKYDIYEMMKEIPTKTFLFDIVYLEGKSLLDTIYKERYEKLLEVVEEGEEFTFAKRIVTSDREEAMEFYNRALKEGHEGVMMKNLNAVYQPGERVGHMVKVKPVKETLDVVIVGAEWGEGRRANWLSSFILAVRDPYTNQFLPIGKMGTGLTDEEFRELTERLKPLIIREEGKRVWIKPKIVIEVGYQELQKSPKYESGFALRFPRLIRFRDDKGPEEADTIERVRRLWEMERGSVEQQ